MTLGNPIGLIGLLSLPVILALHLLRERKRRIVVSDLRLWSFLSTEVHAPRIRRIPITWLLLVDLLVAALISLAWAQPLLAADLPNRTGRHVVVLLDVSSSMQAVDVRGSRLAQAKDTAADLMEKLGSRDVVTLITFGRQAAVLADTRQDSLLVAQERLREVKAGEIGSALTQGLALGKAALDPELEAELQIITDGYFSEERFLGEPVQFASAVRWHLLGEPLDNQAVIELNATPLGGGRMQVFARIANLSDRRITREAVLRVDGTTQGQAEITLPANSTVAHVWEIAVDESTPPDSLEVRLQGRDSLVEDDTAVIGLQPGGMIQVALVAENPAVLQQAVRAFPQAELTVIPPGEYTPDRLSPGGTPFDLTIFRNFLPKAWPEGQVLVVEPPAKDGEQPVEAGEVSLYSGSSQTIPSNGLLQAPESDPVLAGVNFSGVRWGRAWTLASPPPDLRLVLLAGDVPLLLRGEIAQAEQEPVRVVILLADLTQGNFTKHPAFPILMANLVTSARQAPLPPSIQTGEALPLPGPDRFQSIQVTSPNQTTTVLQNPWPTEWNGALDPGLYRFRLVSLDGSVTDVSAGANAGDAAESDLRPDRETVAMVSGEGPSAGGADPEEDTIDLRPWLLRAAILLLVVEAFLAWRS